MVRIPPLPKALRYPLYVLRSPRFRSNPVPVTRKLRKIDTFGKVK
ncbi:hypothetical protein SPV3_ORF15 [Sulfolobus polyhedral virus 3]|nr:hypothetical protein SPV3_ORF15 [Sulfolobus polyhedral virus 3]